MELKVYDWEIFERSKKWYIIFAFIILLVVILSVLSSNEIWWVIVLFFAWWYLYVLWKSSDKIKMIIWKKAIQIWKVTIPWEKLSWFVLEYHTEKKKIHNIVILDENKYPKIYTINDTEKNLENFVNELNDYIPILEGYEQGFFDKFIRKIKL